MATLHQCQYLFVYGSLLSGFKSPAYEYLSQYFELIGNATVAGTMYDMGTHPVATATQTGRQIQGELYKLRNAAEHSFVMAQLDDYEGLLPDDENDEVNYERNIANVTLQDGTNYNAWVYWYKHNVSDRPIVESGSMLEYVAKR